MRIDNYIKESKFDLLEKYIKEIILNETQDTIMIILQKWGNLPSYQSLEATQKNKICNDTSIVCKAKLLRDEYNKNLSSFKAELDDKLSIGFEDESPSIMDLLKRSLMGLFQVSNCGQVSFSNYTELEEYLGNNSYNYIKNNIYNSTTKLIKAAPLYVIKGFNSKNKIEKEGAKNFFIELVADYRNYGKLCKGSIDYKDYIFAIAKGYFDAEEDKIGAVFFIKQLFEEQDLIKEMIDTPNLFKDNEKTLF